MKSLSIIHTSGQHDPVLEKIILKRDAELKELAERNGRHFGENNRPGINGDCLAPYVDELKAGYEKLSAEAFRHLQPEAHLPEGKMDLDHFKEKEANLNKEITVLEDQNRNDGYDLKNFDSRSLYSRLRWAIISSLILIIGEILFNTKAFEVTGENRLFALILSISVSFAVIIFSHFTAFLYKAAKNPFQRRLIVACSLIIVTTLFTALAIFRSTYLASHDIHIHPIYFVLINLFFFIVSTLLSYFVLPTWQEIKENAVKLKLFYAIRRRKKEIEKLKKKKGSDKVSILESSKSRIRAMHYAQYSNDMIRKMYLESVAIFKRANLTYRRDHQTPDCFLEPIPELDVPDFTLNLNRSNRKAS